MLNYLFRPAANPHKISRGGLPDGKYLIGISPTQQIDGIPQWIFEIRNGEFHILPYTGAKIHPSMKRSTNENEMKKTLDIWRDFYGPLAEFTYRNGDWHYYEGGYIYGEPLSQYRIMLIKSDG